MSYFYIVLLGFYSLLQNIDAQSQTRSKGLEEVAKLVKTEGEMFIVVDQPKPEQNKLCTKEISLLNQLQFNQDTVFINYINYTELFCEVYVLRTHLTYHFSLKDIDPAAMRVVEKRYDFGNGIVKEGQPYWFEIQLFTKNNQLLIRERDMESKEIQQVSTVNLMFKTRQTAKDAMALLKNAINEVNM